MGALICESKPEVSSEEVDSVLEHASSFFRWELLEPQNTLPRNVVPTDSLVINKGV
jgi:hypothetical protein